MYGGHMIPVEGALLFHWYVEDRVEGTSSGDPWFSTWAWGSSEEAGDPSLVSSMLSLLFRVHNGPPLDLAFLYFVKSVLITFV